MAWAYQTFHHGLVDAVGRSLVPWPSAGQVTGNFAPEQGNELRRHVLKLVRDIEAHDLGAAQVGFEPG